MADSPSFPQFPHPIEWTSNTLSDILSLYYHDAPFIKTSGKITIAGDPNEPNAWDNFIKFYDRVLQQAKPDNSLKESTGVLFTDKDGNGKFDTNVDIKGLDIRVFVSRDGAALLKKYKSYTLIRSNELVLFLEINEGDIFSNTVMLAKAGRDVEKYAKSKYLYTWVNGQFNISQARLTNLLLASTISEKSFLDQLMETFTQKVDELFKNIERYIFNALGDFINDTFRIPEEWWNSDNANNKVSELQKQIHAYKEKLDGFIKNGYVFKVKVGDTVYNVAIDLLPQFVKGMLTYLSRYISKLIKDFDDLIKDVQVSVAFLAGCWNGLIDLASGICYLCSLLLEAITGTATYLKDSAYYNALVAEYIDNFITNLLYLNWFQIMKSAWIAGKEIKDFLSSDEEYFNETEMAYYKGYIVSLFVDIIFPPLAFAQLAHAAKLEKVVQVLNNTVRKVLKLAGNTASRAKNILSWFFEEIDKVLKITQSTKPFLEFFKELWSAFKKLFKRETAVKPIVFSKLTFTELIEEFKVAGVELIGAGAKTKLGGEILSTEQFAVWRKIYL